MKNACLFCLCSLMLIASSCRKKTILDPNDNLNGGGSFEVKIDGTAFIPDLETAAVYSTDGDLNITAINAASQSVTLSIKSVSGTGTYTVEDDGFSGFYSESSLSQFFADATNGGIGTLNLTTFSNNKAKGTFSFTGISPFNSETIEATNGSFDVTYIEE